jgi:ABC-2 type transport system permease protein
MFSGKEVYDSSASEKLLADFRLLGKKKRTVFRLSLVELQNRYKKTVLGAFWSILNPLLTAAIIYFIFGGLFNGYLPGNRGYFFWVFSGLMLQIFMMQGMGLAANQLIGNLSLITNYRINPVLVASSIGLSASLNFLIGCIALVPAAIISGHSIGIRILLLPLFAFLVAGLLAGAGMVLFHYFRKYDDAAYIFNLVVMIASYLAPFLYPFDILTKPLSTFISANPLTSYILVFRWIVLDEQILNPLRLVIVVLFSLTVFALGAKFLRNRWNETLML